MPEQSVEVSDIAKAEVMILFFDVTGIVYSDFLPQGQMININIYAYIYIYIYIYIYVCVCVCVCVFMYIYIYTNIHRYLYVYTDKNFFRKIYQ